MNAVEEMQGSEESARVAYAVVRKVKAQNLPYESFVREYVTKNQPVVIQDAAPEWKALERWTPEFFKTRFGSETVEVTYGVKQQMAEVIDGVLASTSEKPGPYLHRVIVHQHMPALLPDLQPENAYAFPGRYCSPLMPKRFRRPDGYLKLLIGGVGGKFPIMHYDSDNAHAMITEIYGEKEFVLFAPEDTPYVYPHAKSPSTSQIENPDHVDAKRFPDFVKAKQFRVVIGPGESIFVPSRWWHTARVVTTSVSVCTNIMHKANWDGFVALSCESGGVSQAAKRAYLQAAGMVMTVAEKAQRGPSGTPLARRLSYLSPASSSARR